MSLTIDGNANSITSSVGGVNIPATVGTLSVGPSGSYMIVNSSGVGIGTLTPQEKVHISNSASTNYIRLDNPSGRSYYGLNSSGDTEVNAATNNNLIFKTFGTERARIDSAGRVTMPYQPAFQVRGNVTGNVTAGSKLAFTSSANNAKITFDIGSNWSDANNRFTAPVSGVYCFSFHIYRQSATSSICSIAPRINGSEVSNGDTFIFFTSATGETGNTDDGASGSFFMNLAAGDYVELFVRAGASTILVYSGHSLFGGYLLG